MMAKRIKKVDRFDISEETHQGDVAEKVLTGALDQVKSKSKEHGDTTNSFQMMGEFWTTYVRHTSVARAHLAIQAKDVAQMMVLLKIARTAYGKSGDNHVDEAGYAALAALLDPPKE
jgi:hypothetical protein